jgi:hypothetical protein
LVSRLLLTIVHHRFTGDAWFPALADEWTIAAQEPVPDEKLTATFFDLHRGTGLPRFLWPTS